MYVALKCKGMHNIFMTKPVKLYCIWQWLTLDWNTKLNTVINEQTNFGKLLEALYLSSLQVSENILTGTNGCGFVFDKLIFNPSWRHMF